MRDSSPLNDQNRNPRLMRSSKRGRPSLYRANGDRSAGMQSAWKAALNSPTAHQCLKQLASYFASAAVDAMLAELNARKFQLPVSAAPVTSQERAASQPALPETGFLRLPDIIGDRGRGMRGLIPVSRAQWYLWIKTRLVPKPVKFGRTSVWRAEDVRALIERLSTGLPLDSP